MTVGSPQQERGKSEAAAGVRRVVWAAHRPISQAPGRVVPLHVGGKRGSLRRANIERDDPVGLTLESYPLGSGPSVRYFAWERS